VSATVLADGAVTRTVDSEISQGSARSTLDLDIVGLEQKHDGLESIAFDFTDIPAKPATHGLSAADAGGSAETGVLFGDLCKGKGSTALKIYVLAVRKGREGSQRFSSEEVGFRSVWSHSPVSVEGRRARKNRERTFEILEKVCDGLAFVLEQQRFVASRARLACRVTLLSTRRCVER
jgi:hypothetical protein